MTPGGALRYTGRHMERPLDILADQIQSTLDALSVETDRFAADSGVRCREGCGDCCNNPQVETTVGELLPLARELARRGQEGPWHERATKGHGERCVFYAPSAQDPAQGRCSIYALRPGLCRLFGFAAVRDKEGHPRLAACRVHKADTPEVVEAAQKGLQTGSLEAPLFMEWQERLQAIGSAPSLSEKLPINDAIVRAIERYALQANR